MGWKIGLASTSVANYTYAASFAHLVLMDKNVYEFGYPTILFHFFGIQSDAHIFQYQLDSQHDHKRYRQILWNCLREYWWNISAQRAWPFQIIFHLLISFWSSSVLYIFWSDIHCVYIMFRAICYLILRKHLFTFVEKILCSVSQKANVALYNPIKQSTIVQDWHQ